MVIKHVCLHAADTSSNPVGGMILNGAHWLILCQSIVTRTSSKRLASSPSGLDVRLFNEAGDKRQIV